MPIQINNDEASSLKLFVVLSKAYKTVMERAIKDMKQYGLSSSEFMVLISESYDRNQEGFSFFEKAFFRVTIIIGSRTNFS